MKCKGLDTVTGRVGMAHQHLVISFPSSGLGTHIGAKLQLGIRNVTDELPAVRQSRALQPSRFPSRSLGTRREIKNE